MLRLELPHNNWRPRPYQHPMWRYFERGGRRGVAVWHRRAGKDACCLHMTACRSQERVGSYWHMLPEYGQARRAVWDAVNPHTGVRIIDEAFPREMRDTTREDAMFIRFLNGSTWQLVGSDNYNSLVGSPPAGLIFSEYALADPRSWDYFRPILAENDGWAFFISTPRGRNHLLRLLESAREDPATWFSQVLTVDDTEVFTREQLASELQELIASCGDEQEGRRLFEQEYYCSFSAAIRGAYYAGALARLEQSGAIGHAPYDPRYPVQTWWDLGIGDATAIWFVQTIGLELRVIDYYEASGHGLDHYAQELRRRGYNYAVHLLPHDGAARELGTGRSRQETLQQLKVGAVRVQPQQSVDDGINAVRTLLPSCRFDAKRCERGLEALRQYRADYDEKGLTIKARPVHDWSSHGADAFRTGAVHVKTTMPDIRFGVPRQDLPGVDEYPRNQNAGTIYGRPTSAGGLE